MNEVQLVLFLEELVKIHSQTELVHNSNLTYKLSLQTGRLIHSDLHWRELIIAITRLWFPSVIANEKIETVLPKISQLYILAFREGNDKK